MGQDTETFYISELQKYKIIPNIEQLNDTKKFISNQKHILN